MVHIYKTWVPFLQGCFVLSLVEIGPVFLEKLINIFLLFRNYLPLEKGRALYLNKFKSPSHKDALCQFWLKLTNWSWDFKICKCIFAFLLLSPLGKGSCRFFAQTWIYFTHRYFVRNLVEIGPFLLEKKIFFKF